MIETALLRPTRDRCTVDRAPTMRRINWSIIINWCYQDQRRMQVSSITHRALEFLERCPFMNHSFHQFSIAWRRTMGGKWSRGSSPFSGFQSTISNQSYDGNPESSVSARLSARLCKLKERKPALEIYVVSNRERNNLRSKKSVRRPVCRVSYMEKRALPDQRSRANDRKQFHWPLSQLGVSDRLALVRSALHRCNRRGQRSVHRWSDSGWSRERFHRPRDTDASVPKENAATPLSIHDLTLIFAPRIWPSPRRVAPSSRGFALSRARDLAGFITQRR